MSHIPMNWMHFILVLYYNDNIRILPNYVDNESKRRLTFH